MVTKRVAVDGVTYVARGNQMRGYTVTAPDGTVIGEVHAGWNLIDGWHWKYVRPGEKYGGTLAFMGGSKTMSAAITALVAVTR